MTATAETRSAHVGADVQTLYRDGIAALKGAFSPEWTKQLREDVAAAFAEAIGRPGGAVGRGPQLWYVEVHPQAIRGFVDIVTPPGSQAST